MVSSSTATVAAYLKDLPPDRRKVMAALRKLIRAELPAGLKEGMQYGMISYFVPLTVKPDTYNGQPLSLVAIAAQKSHFAIYLMGLYAVPEKRRWFEGEFKKSGKKMDMGKSCLRFKALEEIPLDLIGRAVGMIGAEEMIALHDAAHGKSLASKKPGKKKPA